MKRPLRVALFSVAVSGAAFGVSVVVFCALFLNRLLNKLPGLGLRVLGFVSAGTSTSATASSTGAAVSTNSIAAPISGSSTITSSTAFSVVTSARPLVLEDVRLVLNLKLDVRLLEEVFSETAGAGASDSNAGAASLVTVG